MNTINVIHPYKWNGQWVFDDASVGLCREPFIAGIDALLDITLTEIPDAANGFALMFSASPFPDYTDCLSWRAALSGGNVYCSDKYGQEGWLCPALFRYFDTAPACIYVKISRLPDVQAG